MANLTYITLILLDLFLNGKPKAVVEIQNKCANFCKSTIKKEEATRKV